MAKYRSGERRDWCAWISKENRQLLKIGLPVVVIICLGLLFLLTRRVPA